jgi:hypothetical protein
VQWGITLAAAGPALKLIGGGIQTYTKLKTGIGAVTKALSAFGDAQEAAGIGGSVLAKSFTGALGTCAPLAAGLAAVGAGVYALHEQSDVLNSTVLKSREEMSWLEEALADLQGVTRYTKSVTGVLGTGTNIDQLNTLGAELTYNRPNWKFGAEYTWTGAWYGDYTDKARVTNTHLVKNNRIVLTALFQF